MTDLIKAIREAKEGSRELDAALHYVLGPRPRPIKREGDAYYAFYQIADEPEPRWHHVFEDRGTAAWGYPPVTTSLDAAVALCERVLPGWWWRVGTCCVSDDATVGPDYNSPVHGERLHREFPPKKLDDGNEEWVFDVDQRPPRSVALALVLAVLTAKES